MNRRGFIASKTDAFQAISACAYWERGAWTIEAKAGDLDKSIREEQRRVRQCLRQ